MRKLADILAIAPVLKLCNIRSQQGNRKVNVVVEYMTEGRMGAIVIRDRETGQEIHRRETGKQEAYHKNKIIL